MFKKAVAAALAAFVACVSAAEVRPGTCDR
jgi:hypothetical protein